MNKLDWFWIIGFCIIIGIGFGSFTSQKYYRSEIHDLRLYYDDIINHLEKNHTHNIVNKWYGDIIEYDVNKVYISVFNETRLMNINDFGIMSSLKEENNHSYILGDTIIHTQLIGKDLYIDLTPKFIYMYENKTFTY